MHYTATDEKTDQEKLEEFLRANFRLDQRIDAINNRKIYSLEIELTRRCNLECKYCYNSSSSNPGIPDFDFNLLKRVLREAYDYGIRSITYLGGEPTLHANINEILKYSKTVGMEEIILYTNGTLIDNRLLETINSYVDSVVIHVDSIDPDVFNNIHNINKWSSQKYFQSIMDNLFKLKASGYPTNNLRHCLALFSLTYKTLEKTLQWAIQDEKMLTSIYIPVVKIGRGAILKDDDLLPPHQIKKAYKIRATIENRQELLLLGPSEYFKQYQISACYLNSNYTVNPYAGIDVNCGNLQTENLSDVFDKNYSILSFSHLSIDKCSNCDNGSFCFGTRTVSFANCGQTDNPDINCWIN